MLIAMHLLKEIAMKSFYRTVLPGAESTKPFINLCESQVLKQLSSEYCRKFFVNNFFTKPLQNLINKL